MEWTTILSIAVGLLGLLFFVKRRFFKKPNYWADKGLPFVEPPWTLFFFVNLFSKKHFWELDAEWCKKCGRIFGCSQLGEPCLYITEPEIVRRILVKDFHLLPDRRDFSINDPIGDSFLPNLTGDDWKRVRSIISPTFSTGRLKKMIRLMNDCGFVTVDNLRKIAEKDGLVDCKAFFGGFTMDLIANTAFGTQLNSSQDPDNLFVQHAKQLFNVSFPWRLILNFMFPNLMRTIGLSGISPKVMKFFVDLTNTVVQKRKESKEDRGDFLQNLMDAQILGENAADLSYEEDPHAGTDKDAPSEESLSFLKQYAQNKTLTSEEFVASCVIFFLAGYENMSTLIAMTAHYLALNPECQAKASEEADRIWKKYPEVDYEALSQAKYLDAAIAETLRIITPGPRLERKAVEDYPIEEANFTVPKGMIVAIPIYAMHNDPEFFPNPEKFDPDRFLPENKDLIRPYTYMPFGVGPRNCIAMRFAIMEVKLCLLHVFRKVNFEPCAQTKNPPDMYQGGGGFQPKTVFLKVTNRPSK